MGEIADRLDDLRGRIRGRFDALGCEEGPGGGFRSGFRRLPDRIAPLCTWQPGLDADELEAAEAEVGRPLPPEIRELLSAMNGGHLFGVELFGLVGARLDRLGGWIGQPVSLRYSNLVERPPWVPEGHFGFGSINGAWAAQGRLFLAATGEVELLNSDVDRIGAAWPSLAAFLAEELPRRIALHDDAGDVAPGAKLLPGATDDWEALAEAHKRELAAEAAAAASARPWLARLLARLRGG